MRMTRQILNQAADLIERNGKAEGAFAETQPGVPLADQKMCALGAIGYAACEMPINYGRKAVDALRRHLALDAVCTDSGLSAATVADWSDWSDDRTVIEGLRGAANAIEQ